MSAIVLVVSWCSVFCLCVSGVMVGVMFSLVGSRIGMTYGVNLLNLPFDFMACGMA